VRPPAEQRRRRSAAEEALLDEHAAGRIGRREFLRRAAILGWALAASGPPELLRAAAQRFGLTVGMPVPAGLIEPALIGDTGGVCMLSQCGEYLAVSDPDLTLRPALALSWQPNADGSVWTFKIREGVRFHDGRRLSARDVAATMNRLADPAYGSIALSAFAGVLSTGGAQARDDATVEFHLNAPNGSFPYLVSSDNYNTVILPADYDGGFERDFNGTGPFRLEK
jgi:peptide/nickel transport system substrate-binding protein